MNIDIGNEIKVGENTSYPRSAHDISKYYKEIRAIIDKYNAYIVRLLKKYKPLLNIYKGLCGVICLDIFVMIAITLLTGNKNPLTIYYGSMVLEVLFFTLLFIHYCILYPVYMEIEKNEKKSEGYDFESGYCRNLNDAFDWIHWASVGQALSEGDIENITFAGYNKSMEGNSRWKQFMIFRDNTGWEVSIPAEFYDDKQKKIDFTKYDKAFQDTKHYIEYINGLTQTVQKLETDEVISDENAETQAGEIVNSWINRPVINRRLEVVLIITGIIMLVLTMELCKPSL